MKDNPKILFRNKDLAFHILNETNTDEIQQLFSACDDFSQLVLGRPSIPADALDLLYKLPPGKDISDKLVLGIRDENNQLIGVLDAVQGYPQDKICFIGLLLLLPQFRGQGMGRRIMDVFADHMEAKGFQTFMLGVVEENQPALQFWQVCGFEIIEKSPPRQFEGKTHCVIRMQKEI